MVTKGYHFNLAIIFLDEPCSFTVRRAEIVKRLRAFTALAQRGEIDLALSAMQELENLIDELAKAPNQHAFDDAWDRIYDWADDRSVWIIA